MAAARDLTAAPPFAGRVARRRTALGIHPTPKKKPSRTEPSLSWKESHLMDVALRPLREAAVQKHVTPDREPHGD